MTDKAVRDFQAEYFGPSEADGLVGPLTWAKLWGDAKSIAASLCVSIRVAPQFRAGAVKKTHSAGTRSYRFLAQCLGPPGFEGTRLAPDTSSDIDQ
jgi:hypothetical protein